ncbi:hypothetical protein X805_07780 [Sphaerotilus natans subsp. natans DSM 6575]|uniref:Uncharacterized protein n=1 Tax=Sphaerotilus natans subsp. natans DSM 6575 TaxID=1286631 RepID=A0A059KQ34_9BURK|nr:hypothetical protein X805_07780 [Sphaerotilus natans subsp. natans DSM 6575]
MRPRSLASGSGQAHPSSGHGHGVSHIGRAISNGALHIHIVKFTETIMTP